jgi:alkaline phosphatase D
MDERTLTVAGHPLSRRGFLAGALAAVVAAACSDGDVNGGGAAGGPTTTDATREGPDPASIELPGDPFTLGVASGDPDAESVVLWTRLAPDPIAGGGMPGDDNVPVAWEVATDDSFSDIVASGTASALAALAHSVHVIADGLDADETYHYRFSVGGFTSPTGRTRTFPAAGGDVDELRFAFSSCQHFVSGRYAAHRHIAGLELDAVVWLGDYIYEGPGDGDPLIGAADRVDRDHVGGETVTLDDYRNRYALYKTDRHLQASHASAPWLVTWDDHEVDNDYAGAISEGNDPEEAFLERRANAYQAWYEHQPVRIDAPDGPDLRIHRQVDFGDLASFWILDTRQYRDDQPTDGEPLPGELGRLPIRPYGPQAQDPSRTILGDEQEEWLLDGLTSSGATWNVLAQQVYMFGVMVPLGETPLVITDTWDGYGASRARLLDGAREADVENLVVLTGDFHSAGVGDLRADPFDLSGPVVGTELMASAISSSFYPGFEDLARQAVAGNPHVKFFDPRNGCTVCTVTSEEWRAEYVVVDDVTDADSAVSSIATFVIASGTPGAVEV